MSIVQGRIPNYNKDEENRNGENHPKLREETLRFFS